MFDSVNTKWIVEWSCRSMIPWFFYNLLCSCVLCFGLKEYQMLPVCDAMRDLVQFVPFKKKLEKHPRMSVSFSKVTTLLRVILLTFFILYKR